MKNRINNNYSTHEEIIAINKLLLSSEDVDKDLKNFILEGRTSEYFFGIEPLEHFYRIFSQRYKTIVKKKIKHDQEKNIWIFLKNMEAKRYKFLRLTIIHTPDFFSYLIYSDTELTEVVGALKFPSIRV